MYIYVCTYAFFSHLFLYTTLLHIIIGPLFNYLKLHQIPAKTCVDDVFESYLKHKTSSKQMSGARGKAATEMVAGLKVSGELLNIKMVLFSVTQHKVFF